MVENTYRIYWTNHNYFSQEHFTTLEGARRYAKERSFEHTIYHGNEIVGWWTTFGGWHPYGVDTRPY